MRPIRVNLIPNMPFHEAVILIESLWWLTKQNKPLEESRRYLTELWEDVREMVEDDPAILQSTPPLEARLAEWEQIADHVRGVLTGAMPLAHFVGFTLAVEGHSRAFLDQFVRELVTGIDVWTGSNRIMNMAEFVEEGLYQNGASIQADPGYVERRRRHLKIIEGLYNDEIAAGATIEQARELLPMAVSLPVTCTTSIRRLAWIVSKRTSFVLQKSLWGPVIAQILAQLSEWDAKIGAKFRVPPCVLRNECPYAIDIEERATPKGLRTGETALQWLDQVLHDAKSIPGVEVKPIDFKDPNPICPLYVDRWAGADRAALLVLARAKHPDWDQVAADYFDYVGMQPKWLTGLPAPTGKSAH